MQLLKVALLALLDVLGHMDGNMRGAAFRWLQQSLLIGVCTDMCVGMCVWTLSFFKTSRISGDL